MNLSLLFNEATGLYSVYKWCQYNKIPKDLFNLIFSCFKSFPRCIYCSLKCCQYDYHNVKYIWRRDEKYRIGHVFNNCSLGEILGNLFIQLARERLDDVTIGKIALISLVKNENSKIPSLIGDFLDKILESKCRINNYRIKIFNIGYGPLFRIIGSFYSNISGVVNNYPRKKHAIFYDNEGYGHNVDQTFERFPRESVIHKYSNVTLNSYLRHVRMTCSDILYGDRKACFKSTFDCLKPWKKLKRDLEYYPYDPFSDFNNLSHGIRYHFFEN
uniref:Uncharacterized protein n=1 Tax=viral metagenome TaxID=1070528 RepID=A0A6C0C754_9ZZZZ